MGNSDFLFASPSLLSGLGRSVDLGGLLDQFSYNFSRTPTEADLRAVLMDWIAVGQDLAAGINEERDAINKAA